MVGIGEMLVTIFTLSKKKCTILSPLKLLPKNAINEDKAKILLSGTCLLNALPDDEILDWSKLKPIAEDV